MTTIFISYRRSDDPYAARGINDALCKQFGKRNVYFDLDAIQAGLDYRKQINDLIARCDVMLVVIGDNWLQADESDRFRLEDDADLVGLEISSALKRDIPVIPVLVGNATIPAKEMLPESVRPLVYRHAMEVRPTANFNAQIESLLNSIAAVAPSERSSLRTGVYGIAIILVVAVIAWQAWQPMMDWASKGKDSNTSAVDIAEQSVSKPTLNEDNLTNKPDGNQKTKRTSTASSDWRPCIYGGWVSLGKDGFCKPPWEHHDNAILKQYGVTYSESVRCENKSFRCNPAIFGTLSNGGGACVLTHRTFNKLSEKCAIVSLENIHQFAAKIKTEGSSESQHFTKTAHFINGFCADGKTAKDGLVYEGCSDLQKRIDAVLAQ